MNKMYELTMQISDNIKEIRQIYQEETAKLSRCDLIQEDLLHYIENSNVNDGFEALEIVNMLHNNRQERRKIKNGLKELSRLSDLIERNRLEQTTNKMIRAIQDDNNSDTYKVKILTDVFGKYI